MFKEDVHHECSFDDVQVTHMPNLEEAIMNTVQNGTDSGSGRDTQSGEGTSESNGASRPSSPSPRSSSPQRQKGAELEIEHSYDGGSSSKTPHSAGLAGKAAQIFGNEAHQSSDIL